MCIRDRACPQSLFGLDVPPLLVAAVQFLAMKMAQTTNTKQYAEVRYSAMS